MIAAAFVPSATGHGGEIVTVVTGARTSGVVTVVGELVGGSVNVEPDATLRVLWLTEPTLNAMLLVAVLAISQLLP